jgi:hypothetical protein
MHNFSDLYIQVRKKENRIYSDEEVRELPYLKTHLHNKEWKLRAKNAQLLQNHFRKNYPDGIKILEMGSGNGWLAHFLSQIPNSTVTGIETTEYELEQAKRVFQTKNLAFHAKKLTDIQFSDYDIVLFAASIQYFQYPKDIFNFIFTQNCEANIICIDSFWYKNEQEAIQAKHRSQKYYSELGFPEMAQYYYHHTTDILKPYNIHILNKQFFYKIKLKIQGLPFMPCISIKMKK